MIFKHLKFNKLHCTAGKTYSAALLMKHFIKPGSQASNAVTVFLSIELMEHGLCLSIGKDMVAIICIISKLLTRGWWYVPYYHGCSRPNSCATINGNIWFLALSIIRLPSSMLFAPNLFITFVYSSKRSHLQAPFPRCVSPQWTPQASKERNFQIQIFFAMV